MWKLVRIISVVDPRISMVPSGKLRAQFIANIKGLRTLRFQNLLKKTFRSLSQVMGTYALRLLSGCHLWWVRNSLSMSKPAVCRLEGLTAR